MRLNNAAMRAKSKQRKSQVANSLERRNWVFTILLSLFFGVVLYVAYFSLRYDIAPRMWSIKQVKVQGNYANVNLSGLHKILQQQAKGGLFELSIADLGRSISDLPWVKSVSITRHLPHTLMLTVNERQPFAMLNSKYYVASPDSLFSNYMPAKDAPALLQLNGPATELDVMLQHKKVFAQLLNKIGLQIASINMVDSLAWEVVTTSGIQIYLGQKEEAERMLRFVNAYPYLQKDRVKQKIARVDLRYPYGLAVQWQK